MSAPQPPTQAEVNDKKFVALLPENLQLKILSMVAGGGMPQPPPATAATATATPATAAPLGPSATPTDATLSGLRARVRAHGYGWQDDFVPQPTASTLHSAAQSVQPALRPAGMSSHTAKWRDASMRGDLTAWLPLEGDHAPEHAGLCASAAWAQLRARLQQLVSELNAVADAEGTERVALPEKAMLAHYPVGSRYVRHSDVSPAVTHRRYTAILYLNDNWTEAHGGQLLIHSAAGEARVAPHLGRLLLFRSAIEHEVLTAHEPRWAITTWLTVERAAAPATAPATTPATAPAPVASAAPSVASAPTPDATAQVLALLGLSAAPARAPPTVPLPSEPEPEPPTTTAAARADEPHQEERPGDEEVGPTPPTPPPPEAPPPRIFVSVASYRDPECPHTLHSLFAHAARPERIVVGVCFQCGDDAEGGGGATTMAADDADAACVDLSRLAPEWRARVRSVRMPWRRAKGPVWARHLIQHELYEGEEYYLQIDSHSRVVAGWDDALIAMLARCGSPKAVLSTYPLPYEGVEGSANTARLSEEARLTLLCTRAAAAPAFDGDGMLRFRARLLARAPRAPTPTPFWAAGFSFSRGELVREVPYDPHLPFLFFGEEMSMALRMWTRGYDLYAPDAHVLYHRWERSYRATFWELPEGRPLKTASQQRVRRILTGAPLVVTGAAESPPGHGHDHDKTLPLEEAAGAAVGRLPPGAAATEREAPPPADAAVWGLGTLRSLRHYEEFAGVDLAGKRVSAHAERGGLPSEESFFDRYASLEAMLAAREGESQVAATA